MCLGMCVWVNVDVCFGECVRVYGGDSCVCDCGWVMCV